MDDADRAQQQMDRAMARFENRQQARPSPARLEPACTDCGDWIEPARLKVFPYAVRCAECQGFYEGAMTRG